MDSMMTTNPAEATSSEVVAFEVATPEIILAMEATPLAPTMLRSPTPKSSTAKEKQKKPQSIPSRQSPRKNPTEILHKGKMNKLKQPHEPMDLDEEELCEGVEEMDAELGEHLLGPSF